MFECVACKRELKNDDVIVVRMDNHTEYTDYCFCIDCAQRLRNQIEHTLSDLESEAEPIESLSRIINLIVLRK